MRKTGSERQEVREAAGITFYLERKRIKTMHIYVKPTGRVLVTCPAIYPASRADAFVEEKADWIRKHVKRYGEMSPQDRMELEYVSGEMLNVWGTSLTLRVEEDDSRKLAKAVVMPDSREVVLRSPVGSTREQREHAVDMMYRSILKEKAGPVLEYWSDKTGLEFLSWHVRKMKSRWGSCNYRKKRICLNTRLAEKDISCLEYVALHEIAHLKEANHGPGFKKILTRYMPDWREVEKKLK